MPSQLEDVNGEFEIDEAARSKLHVERTVRRLVARDLGPHLRCILRNPRIVARKSKDALDHGSDAQTHGWRSEDGPRAAEGHMFPRPRLVALIALEGIKRHDEHALGPFWP